MRGSWAVGGIALACAGCGRLGFDAEAVADGGGGGGGGGGSGRTDAQTMHDGDTGRACSTDLECGRCARCEGTCQTEPVTSLWLGHRSLCYIGAGGTRWCSGENIDGVLGLDDEMNRLTPTRAADGAGWEALYLFFYGPSFGIRAGELWTWGPLETVTPRLETTEAPQRILGDLYPECIVTADGRSVECAAQLDLRSLAAGLHHRCGVSAVGALFCAGESRSEALGIAGLADGATAPVTFIANGIEFTSVAVGGNLTIGASCALTVAGRALCWGHPDLTGTDGVDVGAVPTLVSSIPFAWLDMDWEHTCAGTTTGAVWCWGKDTYGGYIAPGVTESRVPIQLPGTYEEFVMGGHHACGRTGGRWRCFGWNDHGELGNGTAITDGTLTELCP